MSKNKIMSHEEEVHAILQRARGYCAMSEQCESGVRQKLVTWGCSTNDADKIVAQLRDEGYLDDYRYARAYCESKLERQKWSKQKVVYQLRMKQIPKEAITEGLNSISEELYMASLETLARKKMDELARDYGDEALRRLEAYLMQRGFTYDEIKQTIKTIRQ